jgi:hypothetical protein
VSNLQVVLLFLQLGSRCSMLAPDFESQAERACEVCWPEQLAKRLRLDERACEVFWPEQLAKRLRLDERASSPTF